MTGFRKNKEKNREIIEGELLQSKTQEGLVEDEVAQKYYLYLYVIFYKSF